MKKTILTSLGILALLSVSGQRLSSYKPLDPANPVVFGGDYILYRGETIKLGPKAFFIDGQLSDNEASKYPYVFNTINKAAENLTDGTEESPMILFVAPYVYWIDDPDDPAIRVGKNGQSPFGLVIDCEWLRFYGLSDNAENVILACNRGQTIGSQGNFTMFRFSGDGTSSENITFGNYCNVDLKYPLNPELSRVKRASAIVQAQLIMCNGDKIVARNTRFISRLNLCPFVGGKRVLFDRCHFESTDDALCATGLYLNSTFDFYASKPFFAATGTGVILLNCDIRAFTRGNQYFTKGNGQVAILDSRLTTETANYWGWREITPDETRNYQYNVSFNGKPVFIGKTDPASTVDMTGKPVLDAYRFVRRGEVVYNTYNLLCGNDDWDPMGIKDIVLAAEKEIGNKYTMLPVQLLISSTLVTTEKKSEISDEAPFAQMFNPPARIIIETKKNSARLTAKVNRFGNCELKGQIVNWTVAPGQKSLVDLKVSEDGMTCDVIPVNTRDETIEVIVSASTPSGLQAACVLMVAPSRLDPPQFILLPKISKPVNGKLILNYKLDMRFEDQSLVTWYRCTDANGGNPIEVAVSRMNKPMLEYELSAGDVGYFIMTSVAPKHLRCDAGTPVSSLRGKPVSAKDVKADKKVLYTNFLNVSTKNQPKVIPGFWTMNSIESLANDPRMSAGSDRDAWFYGEGTDGAAGQLGLLQGRSASLLYTPAGNDFGDMKLSMTVAPSKTAGQGFSIAHLYMDVLIKFDTKTMTGYALRFIRTTKYGDAVDCMFVKYDNGKVTEISKPVSTSCYRPICNITVEAKGNKIIAHADSPAEYYKIPNRPEVAAEVNIETEIDPGRSGGFGIEYNGGAATMIKEMKVEWK
ncbi:MAG: hypothetical protein NT092_03465 [Bacteroidia bacterium]|nr:hypothetical protein [Bacteroidia bacterium]